MNATILITSVEHAVATAARDVVVGARATQKFLDKAVAVSTAEAPTVEALTGLVDPRAAAIERIGFALLGELEPQVSKVAGDVASEGATPSFAISAELYAELKALYGHLSSEISAAKSQVSATAPSK